MSPGSRELRPLADLAVSILPLLVFTISCTRSTSPGDAVPCGNVRWQVTEQWGEAWNPAGDSIICVSAENGRGEYAPGIYIVDVRTGCWRNALPRTGSIRATPMTCQWHPRLRTVLLTYGVFVGVLDLNTLGISPFSDGDHGIDIAIWSPEGDSIWYDRDLANTDPAWWGGLWIQAAGGGPPRPFRPADGSVVGPQGMAFSPDGGTLAYAALADSFLDAQGQLVFQSNEIFTIRRDGARRVRLTHLNGAARNPRWIFGGRELMFDYVARNCAGALGNPERQLLSVDVTTGHLRSWPQALGSATFQFSFPPMPDPTGTRLLFVADGGPRQDGATVGQLYVTPLHPLNPRRLFSPDSLH